MPAGPLLRQIELAGRDYALCVRAGTAEKRALERARGDGTLTEWMADKLAVQLLQGPAWDLLPDRNPAA